MKDTEVRTVKDRLSKEEQTLAFCIANGLPFADRLEVIAYLRRALDSKGGKDA